MTLDEIRIYCLQKKSTVVDFPFDDVTMVIKVGDKIFILITLEKVPLQINLKCDPFLAQDLRKRYTSVIPGYHMNKRHWNTIILDNSIPGKVIKEMIDNSYALVFNSLTKTKKTMILKENS